MALADEILQQANARDLKLKSINTTRKQFGVKPIAYDAPDDLIQQAENWDYQANKPKVDPVQVPQATVQAPQAPTVSDKPANVDQDTYDTLIGQGIPKERIAELYAPNEKGAFTRIWKENQPEPTPIDERTMSARKNMASLGEGVRVLGDMFGVSQGARIKERKAGDLTGKQEAQEQSERDKYMAKLEAFNTGKRGAAEKDLMSELQDKSKGLAEVKDLMAAKAKAKQLADKEKADWEKWNAKYELDKAGLDLKKKGQAADIQHKKNQDIIGFAKLKNDKNTAKAKKDPNMVQVNVQGLPVNIRKTYVQDVVGRVRNEFGGAVMTDELDDKTGKPTGRKIPAFDGDNKPLENPLDKMSDAEIFTKYKDRYLHLSPDRKYVQIAHKADKFPTQKKKETQNNSIDPSKYGGHKVK